jgi:hypothetical protein
MDGERKELRKTKEEEREKESEKKGEILKVKMQTS